MNYLNHLGMACHTLRGVYQAASRRYSESSAFQARGPTVSKFVLAVTVR
jgi:hypothetical protein